MDDRDRKIILARRRFFIATAVAGLAATQCENPFRPCLKIALPEDAGTTVEAATTTAGATTDATPPVDAADTRTDADRADAKSDAKKPRAPAPSVCLNPYE